jgi:hypothetical protein
MNKIFIVLYWHGQGAHYVMMQADAANERYTTYNRFNFHEVAMPDIDLRTGILRNDNIFICGWYIPVVRG